MPQRNMPENWEPPYPSYSAAFDPGLEKVIVAYLGSQTKTENTEQFHSWLQGVVSGDNGPEQVERATFIDAEGYRNDVYICYWQDESSYHAWSDSSLFCEWWQDEARLSEDAGYWREVIHIPKSRLETLFSSKDGAGMASMATKFTGEIKEHAYWGGMRDRIEDSEDNSFESSYGDTLLPLDKVDSKGKRLKVTPPENLCLIRSAQNWIECKDEELAIYENEVQPSLVEGMNYIRDNPIETGCISCRFMDELTMSGSEQSKTFGMAYFLTMGHLEAWAKSHPSHLAIFRNFNNMVRKLNFQLDLKLWHEVVVLPMGEHLFEYVNCHPQTGLLPYFSS